MMIKKAYLIAVSVLACLAFLLCSCDSKPDEQKLLQKAVEKRQKLLTGDSFDALYQSIIDQGDSNSQTFQAIWSSYRGRLITWKGIMGMVERFKGDKVQVEFIHRSTGQVIKARSLVQLDPEKGKKAFDTVPGQLVAYQGKLDSYTKEAGVITFNLSEGQILSVVDDFGQLK